MKLFSGSLLSPSSLDECAKVAALISGPQESDSATVYLKFLLVSFERTVERNFDATGNMLKDTVDYRSVVAYFSELHGVLLRKAVSHWPDKHTEEALCRS